MTSRSVAAAVLISAALAGCSSAAHAAPAAKTPDSAVTRITRQECQSLAPVSSGISSVTAIGSVRSAVSSGSTSWGKRLVAAAAQSKYAPAGRNAATELGLAISMAANYLELAGLDVNLGPHDQFGADWARAKAELRKADADCRKAEI
jgi:hypothetical protein